MNEETSPVGKEKIVLAAALSALMSVSASGEQLTGTLEKIRDSGSITLGHRESSIPFSYYDDRQLVIGYSQEFALKMVDAIKRELKLPGLQVKLLAVTSQNRLILVQKGVVDLECGATADEAERQQVAFSNTIFIIGSRLMTRKDSGIKGFADLPGRNVVATAGGTSERLLRKMNEDRKMGMNIISARDRGQSFLTLESGRAVAFMMDYVLPVGARVRARNGDDWAILGNPRSFEAHACMMRKDDPDFKRMVDSVIAGMEASGDAVSIYKKWFQSPIPPRGFNLTFELGHEEIEPYGDGNGKGNDGALR
jgi:glutamate/aspartate transport system substrate-binding protein